MRTAADTRGCPLAAPSLGRATHKILFTMSSSPRTRSVAGGFPRILVVELRAAAVRMGQSYAVRLSTLSNQVKILAQELALMRAASGSRTGSDPQ